MIVIMVHICKIIISPGVLFFCLFICLFFFFHFFKILILQTVSRVKGHKMTQNDKKNCLLCPLSWEPSIIWLSFIVHMFKVIISPGVFFIFSKVWWSVISGVKGQIAIQNYKKLCQSHSISPGNIHHMIVIYSARV